jgi:hypothetical protein
MASNERLIELALKGLIAERDKVEQEISDLQSRISGRVMTASVKDTSKSSSANGRMSKEGRQRISAAMKLRWAKHRLETKAAKPARTVVASKKVQLTDAGRKKLSDMMKKRWAEKRKAAKKK